MSHSERDRPVVFQVTSAKEMPPPIIELGPANQTLPLKSEAWLQCQASGTPTPRVYWHKEGVLLHSGGRITMAINGTLFIDELRANDSGLYTCIASSESGNTSWSAYLTISSGVSFHRTPDASALPRPPSKPRIVNATSNSVTLTWSPDQDEGQSKIVGYNVEYYSSNLNTGWVVAATGVVDDIYTVSTSSGGNGGRSLDLLFVFFSSSAYMSPESSFNDSPEVGIFNFPPLCIVSEVCLESVEWLVKTVRETLRAILKIAFYRKINSRSGIQKFKTVRQIRDFDLIKMRELVAV